MKQKSFISSWAEIGIFLSALTIFLILGYFERGFDKHTLYGIGIAAATFLFLLHLRYKTRVIIVDNRYLVNAGQRNFVKSDTVDIASIKYISRTPAFLWKSWGSLMTIFLIDKQGKLRQTFLREINYSDETLSELLSSLKRINPNIEIDPQYIDFLEGKIEHGKKFIHTPAVRNIYDVEKEVASRFGRS